MGKEENINKLKEYYSLLGKIPTREDFKSNNWSPYYDWYARNFGSYENACFEAGLIKELTLSREERINISINELIELAIKFNRIPFVKEYEKYRKKGLDRRSLEKYLNLSYNKICEKFLSEYKLNQVRELPSKQELIKEITTLKNKLGRTPMQEEINKDNLKYSITVYFKVFSTNRFSDIIKELGWEMIGNECLPRDREILLNDFYKYYLQLGRLPYAYELNDNKNIASYTTYIKHFISMENICNLLNINYEENYKGAGAGKIVYDNNHRLCKSFIERDITNFFIDNNIEYEKETYYKDIIKNYNKKKKFDWKISTENGIKYVEYFGLYRKNHRGNLDNRYTRLADEKIKLLIENNVINDCVLIYPEDFKSSSLIDIFQPYFNRHLIENYYTRNDDTAYIDDFQSINLLFFDMINENGEFLKMKDMISSKYSHINHVAYKYDGLVMCQLRFIDFYLATYNKLNEFMLNYLRLIKSGKLINKQNASIEQIELAKQILNKYE